MGRKHRSKVWNYFEKTVLGGVCNICGKEFSSKGNTTNLRAHIMKLHKVDLDEEDTQHSGNEDMKSNISVKYTPRLNENNDITIDAEIVDKSQLVIENTDIEDPIDIRNSMKESTNNLKIKRIEGYTTNKKKGIKRIRCSEDRGITFHSLNSNDAFQDNSTIKYIDSFQNTTTKRKTSGECMGELVAAKLADLPCDEARDEAEYEIIKILLEIKKKYLNPERYGSEGEQL